MEENLKKAKAKRFLIIMGACIATALCLAGIGTASYNYFYNKNKATVQTFAGKEDETKIENVVEEEVADETLVLDDVERHENEDELEQTEEEQKPEEEVTELSEEEKKAKEEEQKRKQEEQKKKKEEEEKQRAAGYPYWLKVNYSANTVTAYKKDESGNYTIPVRAMVCSTGRQTPHSGVYRTSSKYRWGTLIGPSYGQYCTRITGGILFHSVPYLKNGDKSSIEYWEYDRLGQTRSLGCVRLTVIDAKWIYENCPSGTSVEFYSSSNPGPLGKPGVRKISEYENLRGWDPTDPDSNNPWRTKDQEDAKKKAEEEAQKKAEEEKKKAEEEAKRKAEEEAKKKAEEAKKKEEEDAKKKEQEKAKQQQAEEAKKKAEEEARKQEEARKKAEEEAKKQAEEKQRQEEEARKKAEQEAQKGNEDSGNNENEGNEQETEEKN